VVRLDEPCGGLLICDTRATRLRGFTMVTDRTAAGPAR
jgi:hypothetical protein